MISQKQVVVAVATAVAGLVTVLVLGTAVMGLFGHSPGPGAPAVAASGDILGTLAQTHVDVASGALALDPPSKANVDVLGADAVPEKAAPNFFPKHVALKGATRITIAGTNASVVAYGGEEGQFEVISVRTPPGKVEGAGIVPFGERRFLNGSRTMPGGDVNMVGVQQGSRMTFLVGAVPSTKLAELATMIPR